MKLCPVPVDPRGPEGAFASLAADVYVPAGAGASRESKRRQGVGGACGCASLAAERGIDDQPAKLMRRQVALR